ncbi:hypothetical protein ACFWU5_00080 [Nocardia sp. NPDC058640]|uniref:hypothetical protein n=1 Tax=Nocardia sp. NPDC058640 TaxID=3346571 RepID=UPI00365BA825
MSLRRSAALFASVAVAAAVVTGCSTSGTAVPAPASTTGKAAEAAKPTGPQVGTATVTVTGGTGPVTIRYSINGAAEQTATDVTLPWTKDYPVYDKVPTTVTAQGASGCTITMNGMLLSVKNEPNPTCNFAYYG